MSIIIEEVGLPTSKFQEKMDFRFKFSIESHAKIQNFRSIGAMKLFLWPFENCRFR